VEGKNYGAPHHVIFSDIVGHRWTQRAVSSYNATNILSLTLTEADTVLFYCCDGGTLHYHVICLVHSYTSRRHVTRQQLFELLCTDQCCVMDRFVNIWEALCVVIQQD
jgi:hypothetical protein